MDDGRATRMVEDGESESAAPRHHVAEPRQSLEQALASVGDAREESLRLTADNARMAEELVALRRESSALRRALSEAEGRIRASRHDGTALSDEPHASHEALRALAEELEQRVEARTAELGEANAALCLRDVQLRLALRCADAGVWEYDPGTHGITGSPEWYTLMGLDPTSGPMSGPPSRDRWFTHMVAEDQPRVERYLAAVSGEDGDEFRTEFRIRHPDRGLRWIALVGRVVVRTGSDGPARVSGLAFDFTGRKAMEDELRRARDLAEAANVAKTRFLAAASHDLRQPLQAAALYAHVLRGSLAAAPRAREALDLMKASLDSLNGMLNGLLDLSRLEAGAVEVTIRDVAPDALMERLATEFNGVAARSGGTLRCVPATVPVSTDPHLLERVLRNLVANAITHGAGGEAGGGRVLLGCRRHRDRVEFQVWDNGPGIPPDARGVIFEEFRQLGNTERNATHGFGLGLSIVSRIARLLGLEVTVRSRVGRGSVFSVAVPRARAPEPRRPTPAGQETADAWLRGRVVVLVEDDERVRRGLTMTLQGWGARAVAFATTEDLAARLPRLRRRPHALIADCRLPNGSTGRTVLDMVRRRWNVPGVIMTGDAAPERLREALSLGCRLLHKPVEPADLARVPRDALHG